MMGKEPDGKGLAMIRFRAKSKKLVLILAAASLAVAGLILGLAWHLGWFAAAASPLQVGMPGSAAGSAGHYQIAEKETEPLRQRMLTLLKGSGGLAGWYRLAGKYGTPAAERSADYLAADQLCYGQYFLEQDDHKAFQTWWQSFRSAYWTAAGLVRAMAATPESEITAADDFWRTNLTAARLLAQSCSRWPDRQRRTDLDKLSARLLELADQALAADYAAAVPTAGPTPDPAATPTPKPSLAPTPETEPTLSVLRLASLDLYAMQQLAQLDPRWQTLYEQALQIVRDGYLSDALPLYALAYAENQGGYVFFNGDTPAIDTEESLLVLLHLAEAGQDVTRGLSWLRDQMYNQHALYASYHITQGQAVSSEECLAAYALAARLARIVADEDLYQAVTQRLLWHQATSQRSAALSAIFREEASGLIRVTAADNTWALLALR